MPKRLSLVLALFLLVSAISGCSKTKQQVNDYINNSSGETAVESAPVKEPEPKPIDPIAEQIKSMSLDEKIGQMLIVGIEGYNINEKTISFVDKYKVGGFILLGENIQNAGQMLNLLNSIKQQNSKNRIPLFLSIDEEGGRVTRMPKEFKELPTNSTIGQINNAAFSYNLGSFIAEEIKAFGLNMNFAPVLDINSNPKNTVIGDRSFGNNANLVSSLGVETMKGTQLQNVIPVVKHFPGHGDTTVDSHKGLPSVNNDLKRLQEFELLPFKEAIKNKSDAVMIAHILLTKVDKENPSSMSKTIITDLLRKELKFDGVVITDDMTMGAIVKNYKIGEAAVKSVNAGTDIVLVCHGYENELEVINALKNSILKGEITEQRIDESVYRILKLKQKYSLKDEIIKSVDVVSINKKLDTLLKTYIKK